MKKLIFPNASNKNRYTIRRSEVGYFNSFKKTGPQLSRLLGRSKHKYYLCSVLFNLILTLKL